MVSTAPSRWEAGLFHANLVKEVDLSEIIARYRVKQSADYRDYRSFIREFPNGHFRIQAIQKGRALYRAQRDDKLRHHLEAKRLKREEIAAKACKADGQLSRPAARTSLADRATAVRRPNSPRIAPV